MLQVDCPLDHLMYPYVDEPLYFLCLHRPQSRGSKCGWVESVDGSRSPYPELESWALSPDNFRNSQLKSVPFSAFLTQHLVHF